MSAKPRVTVLQPQPEVPLDRFERWLPDSGLRVSLIDLTSKDVPQLQSMGDGLIVLGGRMSAHDSDQYSWIEPAKDLIADALDTDTPILGVCLGHQLIAEALGGEVVVGHPDGGEDGPFELTWADDAASDPVLGDATRAGTTVAMSHHDVVTALPPGAVELAWTTRYRNAAFRVGSAWGVQFHPEASPELIQRWYTNEHPNDRDSLLGPMRAADDRIAAVAKAVVAGFAREVTRG